MLVRVKKTIIANFHEIILAGFDGLNIINAKRVTLLIYKRLIRNNAECMKRIAKDAYEDIIDLLYDMEYVFAEKPEAPDAEWVENYLKSYNPISHYLYGPEAERKQMRLTEEILTAREYRDQKMLEESVNRAKSLWWNQTQVYFVDTVDTVRKEIMEKAGIEKVVWHCNKDEITCQECRSRDGKVFYLSKLPQKHRLCRCWYTPYSGS